MHADGILELTWHGDATVDTVLEALDEVEEIRLTLPANYNHALCGALHPDAGPAAMERLDEEGGYELLRKVSLVSGLEAFARLAGPVRDAGARVRLSSPPVVVISRVRRDG